MIEELKINDIFGLVFFLKQTDKRYVPQWLQINTRIHPNHYFKKKYLLIHCVSVRHLLTLAEKEDSFDLDYDIFEPSMSAFAELFNEKEKMQVIMEDKK